jgi:hypothetical protein
LAIALNSLSSCVVGWSASIPIDGGYVETTSPYVGGVWIGTEYVWRGGRYVAVPGHWEHGRGTWHGGSWAPRNGGGYRWNRGHWSR